MPASIATSALRVAVAAALLAGVAALGPAAAPAQAQSTTSDGWTTIERVPKAPGPNTTVVPRAPDIKTPPLVEVALSSYVTDEDGALIDQGIVWRVFHAKAVEGKGRLVMSSREATPVLKLAPGDYAINASYGRAHLTRQITIKAGARQAERFVLNAGGLRVAAALANGTAIDRVTIDILVGERDQAGDRARVLTGAKPGQVLRLNAGIYQLVSTYGDANAIVRADVTVEAGKLTEVQVSHQVTRTTFKLVTRQGGEALADTQWVVATALGEVVARSVGALPTHMLAPGSYLVTATHGDRSYKRNVTLAAGDTTDVEVIVSN